MNRNLRSDFRSLAQKLEFFDALLVVYIIAFVREYLWIVHDNTLAWILTGVVSFVPTFLYLTIKEAPEESRPVAFWIVVALPLLFVYLMRAAYADLSFDVLNYHIFQSERALRGLLHLPGDFAPASFPFFNNPVAEMITGAFRHVLGFRLGTFANYLALLWAGAILYKFLRKEIASTSLRSLAVLLILLSEQLLSEINNYMVDLLALPLLLEATNFALREDQQGTLSRKRFGYVALLLGVCVALKLTNLIFVLPIGLIILRKLFVLKPGSVSQRVRTIGVMAVGLSLPVVPHAFYLYRLTGNPVFPLYNKIFKSPYWPDENPFDGRWGPQGASQTLLWPFEILFRHERLTELNVYSGRMSLGLCAAVLLVLLVRDNRAKTIGFITISSAVLWSVVTGYIRYGLFLEILSGISLVTLAAYALRSNFKPLVFRRVLAAIVLAVLLGQAFLACIYTFETEWGGRSVGFMRQREYRKEFAEILRDHSLTRYMTPGDLALFDGVGAWVETSYKTSAITGVLKPDIPYLNLFAEAFVATPAALREYRNAVSSDSEKRMLSVVFEDDLEASLQKLKKRGFAASKISHIQFPYYSKQRRLALAVMEVTPDPTGRAQGIFNAAVSILQVPGNIKLREQTTIRVKVRNSGGGVWLARKAREGEHQVTLGNKWLDESARIVVNDDGRAALPNDLPPGAEVELELRIQAPGAPGRYLLMLDMVQEEVSWFYERGSTPAEVWVTVER